MESYRSGHNGAVLKTVCLKGRVGSNPTLSVIGFVDNYILQIRHLEKYPRWLKGHPWKGCRSLIAARGFKSLLLRCFLLFLPEMKNFKKLLTMTNSRDNIIWLSHENSDTDIDN